MDLYSKNSFDISKITTNNYSTSFSLGLKLIAPKFRNAIYGIYGYVRFADEIVDTFHDYDKEILLKRYKEETKRAIEDKISTNPILNSFQYVVNKYNIEWDVINAFLHSMEMDLNQNNHDHASFSEYVYGSAETVGLMCLSVFCDGNQQIYNKLKIYARKLGEAFQKINFLRDLKADYLHLGRNYFPDIDFKTFSKDDKIRLENDIYQDFKTAEFGIAKLPEGTGLGVYIAYTYYLSLFKKIKKTKHNLLINKRIRISNYRKIILMLKGIISYRFLKKKHKKDNIDNKFSIMDQQLYEEKELSLSVKAS